MSYNDVLNRIVEKLNKYPNIQFKKNSEYQLTIFGEGDNGFDMKLYSNENENTLFLSGFHEHFETTLEDTESLLQLLLYALTGLARIKEFSKKDKPYKYTLQLQDQGGQWFDSGITGLLFYKYWCKTSIRYYQNHLLPKELILADPL